MRRWPKPGRARRDGLDRAVLVVGDEHAERAAVDLLGEDQQRPRAFITRSSVGSRSWGWEIGLVVMRMQRVLEDRLHPLAVA